MKWCINDVEFNQNDVVWSNKEESQIKICSSHTAFSGQRSEVRRHRQEHLWNLLISSVVYSEFSPQIHISNLETGCWSGHTHTHTQHRFWNAIKCGKIWQKSKWWRCFLPSSASLFIIIIINSWKRVFNRGVSVWDCGIVGIWWNAGTIKGRLHYYPRLSSHQFMCLTDERLSPLWQKPFPSFSGETFRLLFSSINPDNSSPALSIIFDWLSKAAHK